jgi:hypothetical protein
MSDTQELEEKLLRFAAHNSILFYLMREGHISYPEGEVLHFIMEQLENFFDELIPNFAKNAGKDDEYLEDLFEISTNNINKLLEEVNKGKNSQNKIQVITNKKLH